MPGWRFEMTGHRFSPCLHRPMIVARGLFGTRSQAGMRDKEHHIAASATNWTNMQFVAAEEGGQRLKLHRLPDRQPRSTIIVLAMIMPINETSARRCSREHRHATACRATLQQIAQDLRRTNWEGLAADASLHPGIDREQRALQA
jgi:hypothetical protein